MASYVEVRASYGKEIAAESMPVVPPAAPTLPRRFRNIEILTIAYRTRPDGIARFLPEQLCARGDRRRPRRAVVRHEHQPEGDPATDGSGSEIRELTARDLTEVEVHEAFSDGDVEAAEQALAPDFVNHDPPRLPGIGKDRAGVPAALHTFTAPSRMRAPSS